MKELNKLEFTIDEYLKDASVIWARAMAAVRSHSFSPRDVQLYLDGKCRQMMMDSVSWDVIVMPIIENGFISCVVSGGRVEFFVKVAPRHMSVSLLQNGMLYEKHLELDPASCTIFTESPYETSAISEYGLEKAKSMAVELYYRK